MKYKLLWTVTILMACFGIALVVHSVRSTNVSYWFLSSGILFLLSATLALATLSWVRKTDRWLLAQPNSILLDGEAE